MKPDAYLRFVENYTVAYRRPTGPAPRSARVDAARRLVLAALEGLSDRESTSVLAYAVARRGSVSGGEARCSDA